MRKDTFDLAAVLCGVTCRYFCWRIKSYIIHKKSFILQKGDFYDQTREKAQGIASSRFGEFDRL